MVEVIDGITQWDIGDEIILQAEFKNRAGVLTNPSAATGAVKEPDGVIVPLVLVNISAGLYEVPFSPTKEGNHWWRPVGTGAVKASGERMFHVRRRRVI